MSTLSALLFFLLIIGAIVIVFAAVVAVIILVWMFVFKEIKKKPKYIYTQAVDTQPENNVHYTGQDNNTPKEE